MREARYLLLGVLVCVPVIAAACSSSTATSTVADASDAATPTGDATVAADQAAPLPTADAAPDAPVEAASPDASGADAAAACEANPVDAPVVTSTVESGAPPTMTGGTIQDGKYWRTAQARYGGSMGVTMVAERLDISGGGTIVDDASHESGVDHRGGFVATTSAANLMIHGVCGEFAGLDAAETYTATATAFVTLTSAGRLTTYTKQ